MAALAGLALGLGASGVRADDPPESAGLEEAGFELRLDPERIEVRAGDEGAVSLTIASAAGIRVDDRGPLTLRLSVEPMEGLELARTRYARKHAADARADAPRFDLRYRARKPGTYKISVALHFWLCRKHTCWPVTTTRTLNAIISAPDPKEEN